MEVIFNGKELESGVYRVYNRLKDRSYYGSAKHFIERYKEHSTFLTKQKHINKYLQNDFIKTGAEHFVFEILEITSLEERKTMEQIYLDVFWDRQDKCYNFLKKVAPDPSTFSHTPEETRKKQSERAKKHWADPIKKEQNMIAVAIATAKPEHREKQSKSTKLAWEKNPDRRLITSIKGKERWKNNKKHLSEKLFSDEALIKKTASVKKKQIEKHKKMCLLKKTEVNWAYEQPIIKNGTQKHKMSKEYIGINLLSPEGVLYKNITNLTQFAKQHKVRKLSFRHLDALKTLSCAGWIKYFDLEENYDLFEIQGGRQIKSKPTSEQLRRLKQIMGCSKIIVPSNLSFMSPDGIVYNNIVNVTQFAREHGLSRVCLKDVKNGRQKHHKGWTLYNPI